MRHTTLAATGFVAVALSIVSLASGCTAQPTASLGQQTLTLFHVDGGPELDPAVGWFADAVSRRSGGKITIRVTYSCCGEDADVEEALVKAVAGAKADLGWVGTRVLPELGVDSLKALTAPLLVDNYPLEQAALGSGEAAKALKAVDSVGVTALALVPGSLRYPLSYTKPVRSLADWAGLTVASFHSTQNAATFTAFGAKPVDVSFPQRDDGIDSGSIAAVESSLVFQSNGREQTLPYSTVDVALWPRSSVLIADPASPAATGAIADILRKAASDVLARTNELGHLDATSVADACAAGARFALAGPDGVAAMRTAVEPITKSIAADPSAAALYTAVKALAGKHRAVTPTIPDDCAGVSTYAREAGTSASGTEVANADDPSIVNGSFQTVDYTPSDAADAGFPEAAGQFTFTFSDGTYHLDIAVPGGGTATCDGPYSVKGTEITVYITPGGVCGSGGLYFTATFAVDDRALTLTDMTAPEAADKWLFGSAPLTRVG